MGVTHARAEVLHAVLLVTCSQYKAPPPPARATHIAPPRYYIVYYIVSLNPTSSRLLGRRWNFNDFVKTHTNVTFSHATMSSLHKTVSSHKAE